MKILNLYSYLGGNRYNRNDVKEDIEVKAVELDIELARLYKYRFLNDKVLIAVNKADYQSINAVSAARATIGLDAEKEIERAAGRERV